MALNTHSDTIDTLFGKRDYAAAQRFWSTDYVQHSAHIEPRPLREATHHDQPR
jgi:hypothetical protein